MFVFRRANGRSNKILSFLPQSFSTNTAPAPIISSVKAKRTSESNPTNHTDEHVGLFYTIPDDVKKQLFSMGGLPKPFFANTKTFSECSVMVRQPAVDLMKQMKTLDLSKPAVRYVLYGNPGCGKSLTLVHLLHYALMNNFVIVHVPWAWNWFRNSRIEVANSSKPKCVDLPILSAQWLKHFQIQNTGILEALNLQTSKDYVWSQREITPAGSPVSALITHGINRVKFAGDCVSALVDELKRHCNENRCKVLVAIDGFNAIVGDYDTQLKTQDRVKVRTGMVTLCHAFQEITKQDWRNGVIVVTVDQLAAIKDTLNSHWPIYLLGRQGFEHLDPFIPVKLQEYTDLELNSALDYYEDRMWFQQTEGRDKLGFLSNNNPYTLMTLCAGY